jgi:chromosome partitioning protein
MAHVIVMGNEKGGSGKSTTAMHLIAALTRAGHAVGALDLDLRQKSLFRYLDNREDYIRRHAVPLPMPRRIALAASEIDSRTEAEAAERAGSMQRWPSCTATAPSSSSTVPARTAPMRGTPMPSPTR